MIVAEPSDPLFKAATVVCFKTSLWNLLHNSVHVSSWITVNEVKVAISVAPLTVGWR